VSQQGAHFVFASLWFNPLLVDGLHAVDLAGSPSRAKPIFVRHAC
jgi:hypothetical protein